MSAAPPPLPWRKLPIGEGFVAYPEGPEHPRREVSVAFHDDRARPEWARRWRWRVRWEDVESAYGDALDQEAAVEEATRAWHRIAAIAPRKAEAEQRFAAQLEAAFGGEGPAAFDLISLTTELLHAINWHAVQRFRDEIYTGTEPPHIRALLAAVSAECAVRRTGEQSA